MGTTEEESPNGPIKGWDVEDSQLLLAMALCSISWLAVNSNDSIFLKYLLSFLMISIVMTMAMRKSNSAIMGLFLFGLCLRLFFQSFSGFEKVPWSDAIIDVFVSRSLLEFEEITVFSMAAFTSRLEFYSSWPIVHIFMASVTAMTGVSVTHGGCLLLLLVDGLRGAFAT